MFLQGGERVSRVKDGMNAMPAQRLNHLFSAGLFCSIKRHASTLYQIWASVLITAIPQTGYWQRPEDSPVIFLSSGFR